MKYMNPPTLVDTFNASFTGAYPGYPGYPGQVHPNATAEANINMLGRNLPSNANMMGARNAQEMDTEEYVHSISSI